MAIKSQGTLFHISNENADSTVFGSATFAKVGEVSSVGEADGEASDIETTHLESTAKEFLIGLPDEGNIQIGGNFVSADLGQLEVEESRQLQERRWVKVTWSNGVIWYWKATAKKYSASAEVDGKTPFTAKFRTTGARGTA